MHTTALPIIDLPTHHIFVNSERHGGFWYVIASHFSFVHELDSHAVLSGPQLVRHEANTDGPEKHDGFKPSCLELRPSLNKMPALLHHTRLALDKNSYVQF